jgi:hypothetical protein
MTLAEKLLLLATKLKDLKSFVETEIASLKSSIASISVKQGQQGPVGPAGKEGKPGRDGSDGRDGRDGADGKDGIDGKDGVSVVNASIDFDGALVLSLSDGTVIDAGVVVPQGLSEAYNVSVSRSGPVQFSAYTDTALDVTGYIEVLDANGVPRKLAVVE